MRSTKYILTVVVLAASAARARMIAQTSTVCQPPGSTLSTLSNLSNLSNATSHPTIANNLTVANDSSKRRSVLYLGFFTIDSQADADELSNEGCHTLNGSVLIAGNDLHTLTLNNIAVVSGDFNVSSAPNLVNISAPRIVTINGSFILHDLPQFESLDLPSLTETTGINWQILPSLRSGVDIDFIGKLSDMMICNTSIGSSLSMGITEATRVMITNNPNLDEIALNSLMSVDDGLEIWGNGATESPNTPGVYLIALQTVGWLTVRDVEELSIPALQSVTTGDMTIADNTINTLHLPKLQKVDGSVSITNNTYIYLVDMSALESIGSRGHSNDVFAISGNPSLKQLTNIWNLAHIGGDISISGPLRSIQPPGLKSYTRNFALNSTDAAFDCSEYDQIERMTIKAHTENEGHTYLCRASAPGSNIDEAVHSDNGHRIIKGADASISLGAIAGFGLLLGALFLFYRRRASIMRVTNVHAMKKLAIGDRTMDAMNPTSITPSGYSELSLEGHHDHERRAWSPGEEMDLGHESAKERDFV